MRIVYPRGATPLDPNELEGLLLPISNHAELNEFESESIARAIRWASKSRKLRKDLLSVSGLRELHRQMFGGVWSWAGSFRRSERSIGIDPKNIQAALHGLCENTKYQIAAKPNDYRELAMSFHHQCVFIHPFPNGNGRWGRLATDILLLFNDQEIPSWGTKKLDADSDDRDQYLEALKAADADRTHVLKLIKFAYGE